MALSRDMRECVFAFARVCVSMRERESSGAQKKKNTVYPLTLYDKPEVPIYARDSDECYISLSLSLFPCGLNPAENNREKGGGWVLVGWERGGC